MLVMFIACCQLFVIVVPISREDEDKYLFFMDFIYKPMLFGYITY